MEGIGNNYQNSNKNIGGTNNQWAITRKKHVLVL